jgi:putative SOS response-associated peptidase YedK
LFAFAGIWERWEKPGRAVDQVLLDPDHGPERGDGG